MSFLSDEALANVLSRLPGLEVARLRQTSSQFLHVSENHFRKMTLPIAMVVKFQFNKEYRNQIAISLVTFHDTEAEKKDAPNCILISSSEITVFSHFQPAFYWFQRVYNIKPVAGSSTSVQIPVDSLDQGLARVVDWLTRNVTIGRLQIDQGDFILTKEMMKELKKYGEYVACRQTIPSFRWTLVVEPGDEHAELLKSFIDWRCIFVIPSLKLKTLKKIQNPRLVLLKPVGDPQEKLYGPLFLVEEITGVIITLAKEWQDKKRTIYEFKCRCEYDQNIGYVWHDAVASACSTPASSNFGWKKALDTLNIIQKGEKLVLYNKKCHYEKPTVDCSRLTRLILNGNE